MKEQIETTVGEFMEANNFSVEEMAEMLGCAPDEVNKEDIISAEYDPEKQEQPEEVVTDEDSPEVEGVSAEDSQEAESPNPVSCPDNPDCDEDHAEPCTEAEDTYWHCTCEGSQAARIKAATEEEASELYKAEMGIIKSVHPIKIERLPGGC